MKITKSQVILGMAAVFPLASCGIPDSALNDEQTGEESSALSYMTNLIQNPGAESGTASWTTTSTFTTVTYGTPGFPGTSSPGPEQRGTAFFAGGVSASADATQLIDLSTAAADIDGGIVNYYLAAYLGGYASDNDNARLVVVFRDSSHAVLGSSTLGPVLAVERVTTGLDHRESIASVPIGTREVLLDLQMNRTNGSYDDGYADNLQFMLLDQGFEQNLIFNGDAEVGPTGGSGAIAGGIVPFVPGWSLTSNFTAVRYNK